MTHSRVQKKKENFHSNLLSAGDFVLVVDKDTVNEKKYICVYSLYTGTLYMGTLAKRSARTNLWAPDHMLRNHFADIVIFDKHGGVLY